MGRVLERRERVGGIDIEDKDGNGTALRNGAEDDVPAKPIHRPALGRFNR